MKVKIVQSMGSKISRTKDEHQSYDSKLNHIDAVMDDCSVVSTQGQYPIGGKDKTLNDYDVFGNDVMVKGSEAVKMLGLSRHNFEKCISSGYISKRETDGIALYNETDIQNFKKTDIYNMMSSGVVDYRNQLNDLTGKEWIPETKSYMFQKGLGASHPDAQIEKLHPAPFSFQDIESLLRFFTKKGMTVLDPFGGVGSTAKACERLSRKCISIELSNKYHGLSIERLEKEVGKGSSQNHTFINGDSREELKLLETNSVDFVVTSPPYWGILHKQDQKVKRNRVQYNLDTQYSNDEKDMGNIADYNQFLQDLCDNVFMQCGRVLKNNKYMAIIVSDFRDKGDYVSFHSDIISMLNKKLLPQGGTLCLQGTKVLIQNHKSLHPYGYPFSYVENIHHQYILIFRKK